MRLLAALGALVGVEAHVLAERLRRDALLYGAIGLFALIGLVFGLVGLNAALTEAIGPIWGPLALGGGALAIALIIWGLSALQRGRQAARQRERRRATDTSAAMTTAAITALPLLVTSPVMRKWGLPAAGVAAAIWLLMRDGDAGKGPGA